MSHDPTREHDTAASSHPTGTSPGAGAGPDLGTALYVFTALATELLLTPPIPADPTVEAGAARRPDQVPAPSVASHHRCPAPGDQRDLSQALMRVVSALAHLGGTARALSVRDTPTTPPRPARPVAPMPGRRAHWVTAGVLAVLFAVALRPRNTSCADHHLRQQS